METLRQWFGTAISLLHERPMLATILLALLLLLALKWVSALIRRLAAQRFSAQLAMLVEKTIWYCGFVIIVATTLGELGVNLTALLGAAGIAGVAVGFASQSSLSNIISGLFLVTEKPFEVGDMIRINDKTGLVLSIDLLSVKIRTLDNLFIRIPNEAVIKAEVTTITRFPIRRMDIDVQVAYKEDLKRVTEILKEIALHNPAVLDEPEPLVLVKSFADSGISILLGVWFYKADYLAVKNSIMMEVKARFDAEDIEIPFPHLTLYTGAATAPFPVQTTSGE